MSLKEKLQDHRILNGTRRCSKILSLPKTKKTKNKRILKHDMTNKPCHTTSYCYQEIKRKQNPKKEKEEKEEDTSMVGRTLIMISRSIHRYESWFFLASKQKLIQ